MDLTQHVEELRHQLELAAEAGGDDARVVAGRLTAALESAARLVLLDAISAAAAEITLDLVPGSVDVRLRGRDPEFVVTPPPVDHVSRRGHRRRDPAAHQPWDPAHRRRRQRSVAHHVAPAGAAQGPDRTGRRARRPSVNSWLVRTVSAAVGVADPHERGRRSANPPGGQSFTGWAR